MANAVPGLATSSQNVNRYWRETESETKGGRENGLPFLFF